MATFAKTISLRLTVRQCANRLFISLIMALNYVARTDVKRLIYAMIGSREDVFARHARCDDRTASVFVGLMATFT